VVAYYGNTVLLLTLPYTLHRLRTSSSDLGMRARCEAGFVQTQIRPCGCGTLWFVEPFPPLGFGGTRSNANLMGFGLSVGMQI